MRLCIYYVIKKQYGENFCSKKQFAQEIKLELDRHIISTGGQIVAMHYKLYAPELQDCDLDILFETAAKMGYKLNFACRTPYYKHYNRQQTIVAYYK